MRPSNAAWILPLALCVLSGCVFVAPREDRTVLVSLEQFDSRSPASSRSVRVEYALWNGYGIVFNRYEPDAAEGITSADGSVLLPLVAYSERIWVRIEGAGPFEIDANLVRSGGERLAYARRTKASDPVVPVYVVRFRPM